MNEMEIPEVNGEDDEIAILNEMWKSYNANLKILQNHIVEDIIKAERVAKQFETHHRGMRLIINQLESLIHKLDEIREEREENRRLLDFFINEPTIKSM